MRRRADPDFSLMPWLFPARLRSHVTAFGRFVRLAHGIAYNAFISHEERLRLLAALDSAIASDDAEPPELPGAEAICAALRASLRTSGVADTHVRHILQALRRDVEGGVNRSWGDLLVYSQFAAAPIGRHMLDLMGEDSRPYRQASDALCEALGILKQLRDFREPTLHDNRHWIPESFLADAFITHEHLGALKAKGQTRAVLDRILDGIEQLLNTAEPLPNHVRSWRLRSHIRVVQCRARGLVACFRANDPLGARVGLTWWQRQVCLCMGLVRGCLKI